MKKVILALRCDTLSDMLLVPSGLHFIMFFSILMRAHRISEQLRHLSTLTFRDIEKEGNVGGQRAISVPFANNMPRSQIGYSDSESARYKTITETITAIRSPCAELEGSHRWTIISEKPVDHR